MDPGDIPPHVGVMRAIGDEPQKPVVLDKDRRDDRDIRKVRAAVKRIIQNRHVARPKGQVPAAGFHGKRHGSEMNRDVGGLCHQMTFFVEYGAGKVAALLDVRRKRRPLQAYPHFLGHRTEQMFEDFPFNGFLHERLLW